MKRDDILRDRIPYKADLSPAHLTALEIQTERTERSTPLVFAGRTDIVNRVESRLISREKALWDDDECYTMVIQGAPGAGKTALINHLKKQVQAGEIKTPGRVRAIRINGSACQDERRFLKAIFKNIKETPDTLVGGRPTRKRGGISATILEGIYEVEKKQPGDFETLDLRSVWEMLEKVGVRETVLLCVDETQNLKPNGINEILENLHTNQTGSLKIVPLFAGLLNTEDVLGSHGVGLSRLAGIPTQLGSLSKSEAREVIIGTLNHDSLGLSDSFREEDQNYLASSLEIASDRWPRHLHYYVQGVLLEILEDQQREVPRHEIDLNRVLNHGHDARINYYQRQLRRLRPSVGSYKGRTLIETLRALSANQNIPLEQLENSLSDVLSVSKSEAADVIDVAIHIGILTPPQIGEKVTQIPIPSLRTFIQGGQDAEKTLKILKENHAEQLARVMSGLEQ